MVKSAAITLKAFADTDIGRVRSENQDRAYAWVSNPPQGDPLALLMVADGIGGYRSGGVASQMAIDTIAELVLPTLERDQPQPPQPSREVENTLRQAVEAANATVHNFALDEKSGIARMGTTIACALIRGRQATLAHVGDSRIYLMAQKRFELLTQDHTPTGELIAAGVLDAQDAIDYPERNRLTRAVGPSARVEVDVTTVPLQPNDRLLICSDGLWGMMRDPLVFERTLYKAPTPEDATRELISTANASGGADNIGIVVCDVRRANSHRRGNSAA